MNEEEKEAIENFKKNRGVSFKEADILSNLIDKQQKEIKARLEEIDSLYKMMSAKDDIINFKDDEIKYLEQKLEQYGLDYQILKDDIEGHRIAYVDTPEFEEKYISKDKIKEKIEEIKNRKIGASTGIYAVQVDILEELLGE